MPSAAYSVNSSFVCVQYRYLWGTSTEMSVGMYHVRYSLASYGPTYGIVGSRLILRIRTLVRVHLYRAVRTKVRSRLQLTCAKGDGNSTAVDSDVAVEGARRGSRIRLVLDGDLHRLAGSYGFAGAG